MTNAIAPINLSETMELGQLLAQSGFFADSRQAAQAVVKVLAGRELGFGPIASMTGVNIINGKVALSANLMAAAIKRSGRYNYRVVELSDTSCRIDFFEGGERIGSSVFTTADATKAGLTTGNWQKFPRNMLFARALSNGVKWYCPDLAGGPLYTPDELGAQVDGETGEIIDAPAVTVVAPTPTHAPAGNGAQGQPATQGDPLIAKWQKEQTNFAHAPKPANGQWGALQAVVSGIVGGEDERHRFYSLLFGRNIESANDLSAPEAAWLHATVKPRKTGDSWRADELMEQSIASFMQRHPAPVDFPSADDLHPQSATFVTPEP